MTWQQLENLRNKFISYYSDYVIIAEFDDHQNLIVFIKPFIQLDDLLDFICQTITHIINVNQPITVYVYAYGSNECISITIR